MRKVIEVLGSDQPRRTDLAALAAAVRLSESRLRHLFKREVGVSLSLYDKSRRLAVAAERLETTFLSVKEILADAGYQSASHFTRDFKRHFDLTPTEWRARQSDPVSRIDPDVALHRRRAGSGDRPAPQATVKR